MVARQRLDQPGAITGIARRLRAAERSAPLGFSSITRGGMRVESAEGIRVNQVIGGDPGLRVTGLQLVDGTLRITGRLEGNGTIIWQGTIDLQGPWKLTGDGQITGNVDITGILKLLSELIVENGGKITVKGADGDTVITNSRMNFANGASLRADTDAAGLMMQFGVSSVRVRSGYAAIGIGGLNFVINASGFQMIGLPTIPKSSAGLGAFVGAVVSDGNGRLLRVVAD